MAQRALTIPGLYDYLTRFSGQDEVLAQVARETGELPDAGCSRGPTRAGC